MNKNHYSSVDVVVIKFPVNPGKSWRERTSGALLTHEAHSVLVCWRDQCSAREPHRLASVVNVPALSPVHLHHHASEALPVERSPLTYLRT